MRRIVVLGATGTLGVSICRHFQKQGYRVYASGRNEKSKGFFAEIGIDYAQVDITNQTDFNHLPQEDIDCVLDFAGALPASMEENGDNTVYSDSIVRGTINVLEYMRKVGCRKLVFPQSVYDTNYLFGSKTPIPADTERDNPTIGDHAIYVICKNAAINIIKYYQNTYGINGIILRLPGVYHYHPKPYILINGVMRVKSERVLIEKAKRGETIEIWGDPQRVLESVCVEDFLQIVELCVKSDTATGIYNVGNGGSTLEERILGIVDVFCPPNNKSQVVYCPEKKDCTQYVLDIQKTMDELGYRPKYNWHDYLLQLKWQMENQPNKDIWGSFDEYYDLLR